jgi:hypothetical protein
MAHTIAGLVWTSASILFNPKSVMVDDAEKINDVEVFDTSKTKVEYSRTRDTRRVNVIIHDPAGISELKLLLILHLEIEKIEKRLGIHEAIDNQH